MLDRLIEAFVKSSTKVHVDSLVREYLDSLPSPERKYAPGFSLCENRDQVEILLRAFLRVKKAMVHGPFANPHTNKSLAEHFVFIAERLLREGAFSSPVIVSEIQASDDITYSGRSFTDACSIIALLKGYRDEEEAYFLLRARFDMSV